MSGDLANNVFLAASGSWTSPAIPMGAANNVNVALTVVSGTLPTSLAVEGSNDRVNWKQIGTITVGSGVPSMTTGNVGSVLAEFTRIAVGAGAGAVVFNVGINLAQS